MRFLLQSLLNHTIRRLICCLLLKTKQKIALILRQNYEGEPEIAITTSWVPHFIKFFDWQTGNPFFCSIQFSRSVVSYSLWPHGLQHARPPCASPTPGVYSNSCPLSPWCHWTISSSVIPFSSHLQSFPASGSFQMSQFFESGGQSTGVSASTSVLLTNTQNWSSGLTGWISLQSKALSRGFASSTVQKHQLFSAQLYVWFNSHIHTWPLEKP